MTGTAAIARKVSRQQPPRPRRRLVPWFVMMAAAAAASLLVLRYNIKQLYRASQQMPFAAHQFYQQQQQQRSFQAFVDGAQHYGDRDKDHEQEEEQRLQNSTTTSAATRRPLSSLGLLSGKKIVGNVQFLLDFAILGFAKCGTTSILKWLDQHPQVATFDGEIWSLKRNQPHQLIRRLYYGLPADDDAEGDNNNNTATRYKRGYKNPAEITDAFVLDKHYRRHWPHTRLIVSLRHPMDWFVSLYNFRVQNLDSLPPPHQLVGPCMLGMKSTCTHKGNFAYHLMRLGKQNVQLLHDDKGQQQTSPFTMDDAARRTLELDIANHHKLLAFDHTTIVPLPNPVFLMDLTQLSDENTTRRLQLQRDMTDFLQLSGSILPDPLLAPRIKPGRETESEIVQADKTARQVTLAQICDTSNNNEMLALRTELLRLAQTSSLWIRHVFLNAPGVYCSDKAYLQALLEQWMDDPCETIT